MVESEPKLLSYAAHVLLALLLLLAVQMLWWNSRTFLPEAPRTAVAAVGVRSLTLSPELWQVFRSPAAQKADMPLSGGLAARFRLAGVFIILTDAPSEHPRRCAILDDLSAKAQLLAEEGGRFDGGRVHSVALDHVVLVDDGGEEAVIWLAPSTLAGAKAPAASRAADTPPPEVLESNRFGNRIGENRWEFRREAVMDYYREMMDSPERVSALFLSMEPDFNERDRVAGYRLNMVGEQEFYTQVGLQQGDIVRKVNSLNMTSRRRAEHFISQFVQNQLDTVVLDIERDGQPQKLIYLLR